MKKTIAIGDIHGLDNWKKIIANENPDKVIFVGDYFDAYDQITNQEQLDNFNQILNFKKSNVCEVVMLLGNHDYHYLSFVQESYSGFSGSKKKKFEDDIANAVKNKDVVLSHVHGNILFSHAGVSKTFINNVKNFIVKDDYSDIETLLNDVLFYKPILLGFGYFSTGMGGSIYGDDVYQSPIWIRPRSLELDKIDGYVQVVGHTRQEEVSFSNNVYYIDALRNYSYLEILDDKINIKKLN